MVESNDCVSDVNTDDGIKIKNDDSVVSLIIGLPTGGKFTITLPESGKSVKTISILSLKEHLASLEETQNCPIASQRLMFKGRILENDQTLFECGIEDNATLFLVKLSASAAAAAAATTQTTVVSTTATAATDPPSLADSVDEDDDDFGIPIMPEVEDDDGIPIVPPHMTFPGQGPNFDSYNDNMYGALAGGGFDPASLLSNPAILGMMENVVSNNPYMVRNLIQQQLESNPALQEMMESNPAVGQLLNDPGHIDELMQMMQNPEAMQQAMRSQDLALSQIENMPGGFAALTNMYETMQQPLEEGFVQSNSIETTEAPMNSTESATDGATGVAMPNPWSTDYGNNSRGLPSAANTNNPMASLISGGPSPDLIASILGGTGGGAPGSGGPSPLSSLLSSLTGSGISTGSNAMPSNANSMISQMMNPDSMSQFAQMGEQFRGMQTNYYATATGANPWQGMGDSSSASSTIAPTTTESSHPDVNTQLQGIAPLLRGVAPPVPNPTPQSRSNSGSSQTGLDFSSLLNGLAPHLRGGPQAPSASGTSNSTTSSTASTSSRPVTLNISNLLQGLAPHLRESMTAASANRSGSSAVASAPGVTSPLASMGKYHVQLKALNGMGFDNEEQNITALDATKGNLNSAVDMLLAGEVPQHTDEKKSDETNEEA